MQDWVNYDKAVRLEARRERLEAWQRVSGRPEAEVPVVRAAWPRGGADKSEESVRGTADGVSLSMVSVDAGGTTGAELVKIELMLGRPCGEPGPADSIGRPGTRTDQP